MLFHSTLKLNIISRALLSNACLTIISPREASMVHVKQISATGNPVPFLKIGHILGCVAIKYQASKQASKQKANTAAAENLKLQVQNQQHRDCPTWP